MRQEKIASVVIIVLQYMAKKKHFKGPIIFSPGPIWWAFRCVTWLEQIWKPWSHSEKLCLSTRRVMWWDQRGQLLRSMFNSRSVGQALLLMYCNVKIRSSGLVVVMAVADVVTAIIETLTVGVPVGGVGTKAIVWHEWGITRRSSERIRL